MAKRGKHPHPPAEPLRSRLDRAVREGRFQQALELSKQLYKDEPKPEHLQLVKEAYLGRARQQTATGHTRDAIQTLEAAGRLDPADPVWQGQLAAQLAAAGGVRQALAILERLPSPEADRVRNQAIDSAVRQEQAGRATLPADLHGDFDRIVKAFGQVAVGQDDAARETLQAIGLRSPFQEWKVLLRGLQAYYANDDVRALEIWQRLDPARLPSRLAAPFRARLDPAYRAAQSPATQTALHRQFERLSENTLVTSLRALRAAMEHPESLAQAFRLAEGLVPTLRTQNLPAAERLARCFYWAIQETGPQDIQRFQRVFGAPPDDPHFHRLRALAQERAGNHPEAHKAWQDYEKDLAANPQQWPADQVDRARALIWARMGDNADRYASDSDLGRSFFFEPPVRMALSPSAERCFQRSIELAPDRLEPYEALLDHLLEQDEKGKAEKIARKLLQRFPTHAPTLQKLADLVRDTDPAEALTLYARALQANPLDPHLRAKVFLAHLTAARQAGALGQLAEARAHLDVVGRQNDARLVSLLSGLRAALAFKAGEVDQAEALVAEARAASTPLAVAFQLLGEAVRLKLDRKIKARFEKEFKEGVADATPDPAEALVLGRQASLEQAEGMDYHGFKTHVKKVVAYLERVPVGQATEEQWKGLAAALESLGAGVRVLRRIAEVGHRKFPHSPLFLLLEARTWFTRGEQLNSGGFYRVRELTNQAERLVRAMPPGEERELFQKAVEGLMEHLREHNPMFMSMHDVFGRMFEHEDDDDDDEYDEI